MSRQIPSIFPLVPTFIPHFSLVPTFVVPTFLGGLKKLWAGGRATTTPPVLSALHLHCSVTLASWEVVWFTLTVEHRHQATVDQRVAGQWPGVVWSGDPRWRSGRGAEFRDGEEWEGTLYYNPLLFRLDSVMSTHIKARVAQVNIYRFYLNDFLEGLLSGYRRVNINPPSRSKSANLDFKFLIFTKISQILESLTSS